METTGNYLIFPDDHGQNSGDPNTGLVQIVNGWVQSTDTQI